MAEKTLFPSYISRRAEEEQILQLSAQVRSDGKSRAVLLYGSGGVGKTWLVRHLAETNSADSSTAWIGPIDSDDSEYWLLSNLERLIVDQLEPDQEFVYFRPYQEFLSRLPVSSGPGLNRAIVLSHLGRIKRVFVECYETFLRETGQTAVVIFDTVEAIRGMDLLVTLTQLMKALPATLFILSGRPQPDGVVRRDPIKDELEDPHQNVPVTTIVVEDFPQDSAIEYLDESSISVALSEDEKLRLVHLTRGHPLWLAFTVSYLSERGLPEEAARSLEYIEQVVPYRGTIPHDGQDLQEAFNRRLVAPYRETDFWHEAVKRLAVARESVSPQIWTQFMADRPPPEGVTSIDQAWPMLLAIPWIRTRANRHYVTLHDAVAEELAQRIIPMHDQGREWRQEVWRRAAEVYGEQIRVLESELYDSGRALEQEQRTWEVPGAEQDGLQSATREHRFIDDVSALDVKQRELCQLKAVRLYYKILCNPQEGCELFLELLTAAAKNQDLLFQELLALEMERFLPEGPVYAFGDVIGEVIEEFREWLNSDGQDLYLEVGLSMADYLIRSEQPRAAHDILSRLPEATGHRQRFRLNNLRGNALMRVPGRVQDSLTHFEASLTEAMSISGPDGPKFVAKAHKELGFFYRNDGQILEADAAYQSARDAILSILTVASNAEDREEMASIQTNWAYVKGLSGSHREGTNLVESAIKVRQRLGRLQEEGTSWSVLGEVHRYARRFNMAWKAYARAEQIFQELRNWSWLGIIYQEQAICLFQAAQDGIELTTERDAVDQAKRLVKLSLDLCRDLAIRSYPSALNRAGRIYGDGDPELALHYLEDGIIAAREMSDGWFWFANLIEYVELNYRLWAETGQPVYHDQIVSRVADVGQAMDEYEFSDLKGRWNLIQGHLRIRQWLATREADLLDSALERYKQGFAQIAQQHVGSSGAAAIAGEFETFAELVWKLPDTVRAQWHDELRRTWSGKANGATLLLARLEELY